jgi:hypothetical protein
VQLAQEQQPAHVDHAAQLTVCVKKRALDLHGLRREHDAMTDPRPLTLRLATAADAAALHRLAALDSQRDLAGDVLVAEVAGRPVAALSLADDRAIADPFERSASAVELLRARAARSAPRQPRRRGRAVLAT